RASVAVFLVNLMRSRATQLAGAAALLLALFEMGRFLTGEDMSIPFVRESRIASPSSSVKESAPRDQQLGAANATVASTDQAKVSGERGKESDRLGVDNGVAAAPASVVPRSDIASGSTSTTGVHKTAALARFAGERNEEAVQQGAREMAVAQSAGEPRAARQLEQTVAGAANRKLIRNARVDLEVRSFDEAVQQIAGFANEAHGYIATSNSDKQENGKLRGEVVVKVLPENLDDFLEKLRGVGDLKNQTSGTDDVTKQYFDADARLKNAQAMEQRLLEVLKRKSDDINDLLAVEKELGRVREQIEQMQGELKFMDTQAQFATVTIALAEKDMDVPAGFLLKERAQLALYAQDVEKSYEQIKALVSPKIQITNATLDRDNAGRVSARISMLIAPEESDAVIAK